MVLILGAEDIKEKRQQFVIKGGICAIVSEWLIGVTIFLDDNIDKFHIKAVDKVEGIVAVAVLDCVIYLFFYLWKKVGGRRQKKLKNKR